MWPWFVIYFILEFKAVQSLDTFTEENIKSWPLPGLLYPRESETREVRSFEIHLRALVFNRAIGAQSKSNK